MKLYIDTRNRENISISILDEEGKIITQNINDLNITPESTLELINSALGKAKLNLKDIKEIVVEKGPGSYTGIRVGVAIANALSFSLNIPVNNKKISDIEIPKY